MTDDFWTWAVRAYGAPGVAGLCLELQDAHGEIVPLLLWAAWAAHKGGEMDEALAAQAIELAQAWSQNVIAPLRIVRRRLKSSISEGDDGVRLALRDRVKATELAAERSLMDLLESLVPQGVEVRSQSLSTRILNAFRRVSQAHSPAEVHALFVTLAEALS